MCSVAETENSTTLGSFAAAPVGVGSLGGVGVAFQDDADCDASAQC